MKFIILPILNILLMIFLPGKSWILSRLKTNNILNNHHHIKKSSGTTIKTIKYYSLYLSKADDNYGIKNIYNSKDLAVIWKASNVGMFINDSVYRPAAISVEQWIHQEYISNRSIDNNNINNLKDNIHNNNNIWKPFVISHLKIETSGLLLIALNSTTKELLENNKTLIKYTYTAIVKEVKSLNIHNNNNNNNNNNNDNKISIISSKKSDKYGSLHMIKIDIPNTKHSIDLLLDTIIQLCRTNNYEIIDYDTSKSMLTLTEIDIYELSPSNYNNTNTMTTPTSNNSNTNNSDTSNSNIDNTSINSSNIFQLPINFRIDIPKKFIKFINKEEIFYNRKNNINININEQVIIKTINNDDKLTDNSNIDNNTDNNIDNTDNNRSIFSSNRNNNYHISASKVIFNQLEFLYPSIDSLQPRNSSEILVHTCIEYIQNIIMKSALDNIDTISTTTSSNNDNSYNNSNNNNKSIYMPSILDIGTASGALLISVLSNYINNNNSNNTNYTSNSSILGVGIDINDKALSLASYNANLLLSKQSNNSYINIDNNNNTFNCNNTINNTTTTINNYKTNKNKISDQQQSMLGNNDCNFLNIAVTNQKTKITCMFQHHNYSELQSLHNKLTIQLQGEYNGFDIIICNPPYLSYEASSNRISKESKLALIAGDSGYEAYHEICNSIRNSINNNKYNNNTNNKYNNNNGSKYNNKVTTNKELDNINNKSNSILKPKGYVIFQISAAEKALLRIKNILKMYRFEIIMIKLDHRGMQRCIVAVAY